MIKTTCQLMQTHTKDHRAQFPAHPLQTKLQTSYTATTRISSKAQLSDSHYTATTSTSLSFTHTQAHKEHQSQHQNNLHAYAPVNKKHQAHNLAHPQTTPSTSLSKLM